MDKRELAIVLGATVNMTFALANVLMGIKSNLKKNFDIIVFHKDITDKEEELLNSIIPCDFKDYNLEPSDISNHSLNRYSLLAYSRYECFSLLDKYKKILWLDIDVFIQKDLSDFIELDTSGIAMWRNDLHKNGFNFSQPIENYDMESNYYNTGVILLSDKLSNYNKMTDWCYKKTKEYGKKLICADQGILNLLVQEFNCEVTDLNEIYNCHPEKEIVKDAAIIHPYAEEKLWNYYYNFEQWNENYKKWLRMGGSSYKGKKAGFCGKIWIKFKKKYLPEAPDPRRHTGKFFKYVWKYNFQKAKQ